MLERATTKIRNQHELLIGSVSMVHFTYWVKLGKRLFYL